MMMALEEKELNLVLHSLCPYCSLAYAQVDKSGAPTELPRTCKRCKSPMDPERSREFAEEQAQGAHDPVLAQMGDRIRTGGMGGPPRDAAMRGVPEAKAKGKKADPVPPIFAPAD